MIRDPGRLRLLRERPRDNAAVEEMNEAAFGPERQQKIVYRLREGVAPVPELSFVAVEDGALLGSVRFWPVSVGGHEELLLGPLAVRGDQRYTHRADLGFGVRIEHQLIGIGTAVGAHRNRFAAPDQLGAG